MFYAHILNQPNSIRKYQTVTEHSLHCAELAADCICKSGLRNTAYLAGILHDMGKFKEEFQEYLFRSANGEAVQRGSVIHTFSGVRYVLSRYHTDNNDEYEHNDVCVLETYIYLVY